VPPEIKQLESPTTLPNNVHLVSLVEKPEPERLTVDPAGPEEGLREMDGLLMVVVVADDVVV
jgi:hypothetical protein